MSYVKTNWIDGNTPASAANMNNLENGVSNNTANIALKANQSSLDIANTNIATLTSNVATVTNTSGSGWFKDTKTGYIHQYGTFNASGIAALSFYIPYTVVPNVRVTNASGTTVSWNTITIAGFNVSGTGVLYWVSDGK